MRGLFSDCSNLINLPDISKWNTNNVNDLSELFSGCTSLKSLPDISNWDISKVTNISQLFYGCSSLESLPDISKWNTNNIIDLSELFYYCENLIFLPDISKWKIKNEIKIERMFEGCKSLFSLPDISKWNNIIDSQFIVRSSSYFKNSYNSNFNELNKISSSIKSSSSNNKINLEEKYDDFFENLALPQEGTKFNEYYENFYNVE